MDRDLLSKIITGKLPYQNIQGDSPTVLIGKAERGPKMVPVKPSNLDQAVSIFGRDSELTRAYAECIDSGGSNIYLIKINGKEAYVSLKDLQGRIMATLYSVSADEHMNDARIEVSKEYVELVNNDERTPTHSKDIEGNYLEDPEGDYRLIVNVGITSPITGRVHTFEDMYDYTIDELITLINERAILGSSGIYALGSNITKVKCKDLEEISYNFNFASREDFVDDIHVFERVYHILQELKMTNVRNIGILGLDFFAKAYYDQFVYQYFSEFTKEMHDNGNPCFITMGLKNARYDSRVEESIENFLNYAQPLEESIMDGDTIVERARGAGYTISEYINLIVARVKVRKPYALIDTSKPEVYLTNGVASYCGIIDSLEVGESTTNKPIKNVVWENITDETPIPLNTLQFTDREIKRKTDNGLVVLNVDQSQGVNVYQGVNLLKKTFVPNDTIPGLVGTSITYEMEHMEAGTDPPPPQRVEKNGLLNKFSNVNFILDFNRKMSSKLDPLIGEPNVKPDIVLILNDLLREYDHLIKNHRINIERIYDRYSENLEVTIDLEIYGEIGSIVASTSITA